MTRARVPLFNNKAKSVTVDLSATDGATVGLNLLAPDGSLVKWTDIFNVSGADAGDQDAITTTDLPEGINLYFTNLRAQSAVGGILANSANVTLAYVGGTSITANLTAITDAGGGTLQKTAFDAYGRKTGTSSASTTDLSEGTGLYFTDARSDARITAQKGAANGLAPLGSDNKINVSYLPAAVLGQVSYQGTWDASLGTPPSSTPSKGWYYIVTVAGSTSLSGITDWKVGDWAIYSGTAWNKVDNTDAIASWNGRTGIVVPASGDYTFAQLGAKPTTLLGYGITDAEPAITTGTTAQYLRGDKTWRSFLTDVLGSVLTGLSTASSAVITAADSVLVALGKLQAQITANLGTLTGHTGNTSNPHSVTKAQVGLSAADNTSDVNKPVSTAQQTALDLKYDKTGGVLHGAPTVATGDPGTGLSAGAFQAYTDNNAGTASIRAVRGTLSSSTGWLLRTKNVGVDVDALLLAPDGSVTFGSTLYIDPVSGRVGIGAPPVNFQFEVAGPTGGMLLTRTLATAEPFVSMANSTAGSGGQLRGLSAGGVRFTDSTSAIEYWRISPSFLPGADNLYDVGSAIKRARVVYAGTGTINTSDAREKTAVVPLSDAELAASAEMARAVGTYQWLAQVTDKGADNARHHAGLTVQRAIAIMQAHGLDPMRYGFICYDQWDELPEIVESWPARDAVLDEDGNVVTPAVEGGSEITQTYRPAGDRYSFRTDELLLFMARGFDARLSALEAKL